MSDDTLTESEKRAAEIAERIHLRNAAQISGNRYQAKLVWTLRPFSADELRKVIEAEGSSPFVYLTSMLLDRRAIQYAGAPYWAQYTFLVMVEVRAIGLDSGGPFNLERSY